MEKNVERLMRKTKKELIEIILKQDDEILALKNANEALKDDVKTYNASFSNRCNSQLEETRKIAKDNERLKEELRKANQLILDQQSGMDENTTAMEVAKQTVVDVNKKNRKLSNLCYFLLCVIAIMLGTILIF